jgi:D-amino-acid oxidase
MIRKRITVIGAGVSGLTCALRLSDDHDVRVIAKDIGIFSDSSKATAIWHVYLVPETNEVLDWAANTLRVFYELAQSSPDTGIQLIRGVELFRKGTAQVPAWAHIPRLFSLLSEVEVAAFNLIDTDAVTRYEAETLAAHPVLWGYHIEAPVVSMHTYLPWLEKAARQKGVRISQGEIRDFAEAAADSDVIVNCAGFGARLLAKDPSFMPYKGQYFVLSGDDEIPLTYVGDDDHPGGMAYMIPRSGEVLIGGSAEKDRDDLEQTLDFASTLRRAGLYVPSIRKWQSERVPFKTVVGVRPVRNGGIRLEMDKDSLQIPIVHNYGHGGSGFSLSWGCAQTVHSMISSL